MRSTTFPNLTKLTNTILASGACLLLMSGAQAQINVSSRQSTIRYGWVHGGGPDVHSGEVTNIYTDLLGADLQGAVFSDATAGEWSGHTWDTSVHCEISSAYSFTGVAGYSSRIQDAQSTLVESTAGGDIGLASMQSNNPGNENVFYFRAVKPSDFHLTGSIVGGSSAFTHVTLQRFNGFNWDNLFLSFMINGTDIVWDVQGTLTPGSDYRLISAIDNSVGGTDSHLKTMDYDFRVTRHLSLMTGRKPD